MTTTASGLYLWEIVVEYHTDVSMKKVRRWITTESKCTGGAHKKAVEFITSSSFNYDRPFIRRLEFKGLISA